MTKAKNFISRKVFALALVLVTMFSIIGAANAATTTEEGTSLTAVGYYDSHTGAIEPATTTSIYFVTSDGAAATATFTDSAITAYAHDYYAAVDASLIEGVTTKAYAYADEEDFTTTLSAIVSAAKTTAGSAYTSTLVIEAEEEVTTPEFQSVTSGSKKLTVKWNRSDEYPDGFQIRYRVSGTSTWKTKTCAGAYTNKYIYTAVTNLKAGTKYELQIRAYNIVNAEEDVYGGDYVYSDWSDSVYASTK